MHISKPLNVGIIGTGFGLNVQLPIFQAHPLFKVRGICGVRGRKLHSSEVPKDITNFTKWEDMLNDQSIDLIIVTSIPSTHYTISKEVMASGYHVLCEKPFMMNASEASEIRSLQENSNVKGFIDFEWRYLPARQKVKRLLEQKEIGEIMHIDYQISSPGYQSLISTKQGWMGKEKYFGGMLGALGSHMIDTMTWLVDEPISWVNAHLKTHISHAQIRNELEQRDADDTFMIHGELVSGATFQMGLLNTLHHGAGSRLAIYGHQGSIVLSNDRIVELGKIHSPLQVIMDSSYDESKYPRIDNVDIRYIMAFNPFLNDIYVALQENKFNKDLPTFVHAYQNQLTLDAVKHSSENGRKVNIKEMCVDCSIV
ncbi:hypothetical protein ASG61_20675 [Bacillus sp. Leaf75]|jgi:predicted dehydrogenase|nr:hypothetical protein ASG61_20675 [Bacillus sp. Leaf75]